MKKKPILSIIVVSYNTKKILSDCLDSLWSVRNEIPFEVIVSDNGSEDGSVEMIKNKYSWIELIENKKNLGFSKGNNVARDLCKGNYVLFLNSDTVVHKKTLSKTVDYMERHSDVGSMTCKIVLQSGELDKDTRRSFPTPWVAFTHLVIPLDKIFPTSSLFARYWYGYISEDKEHEVDVIQGAFHLSRRSVLDDVGWFDEDYFLDGEDIDLCWKIKEDGWKIMYVPDTMITHVKKASKKHDDKEKRKKFVSAGTDAMALFYKKRLSTYYPSFVTETVLLGVALLKRIRLLKLSLSK